MQSYIVQYAFGGELSLYYVYQLRIRLSCHILEIVPMNLIEFKFSFVGIHSKNLVAILHLLVALAAHYKAPIRLPEDVHIKV